MEPVPETRIQLCGRLTVRMQGQRIEELLPGRQGRLLFGYLATHRHRPSTRAELMNALWPAKLPAAADTALSSLLTKLRGVLGGTVVGKQEVRLVLPAGAWVDLEAASEGLHRAVSAVSQRDWARAWGPSRVALHIAQRGFLPGYEGTWLEPARHRLEDVLVRAHECVTAIGLGLATGSELASAERSARELIRVAPFRESGYRFLMEVLASQGNVAEALLTYESLRQLLRKELGAAPAAATQALHKRLLQGTPAHTEVVRELRTVLFTDIVRSTERLAALGDKAWLELRSRHDAVVREALAGFGGREVDNAGDGFLATFPTPLEAVCCASHIIVRLCELDVDVRAGVHTGECEVLEGRVSGIAVHVGARVAALAQSGEMLVSSTVKDLIAGSGIAFDDRGSQVLRGVPGTWRIFAVRSESVPPPARAHALP
ncbi:MAG TPA: BTAD domain-containing putative transcriptional regulator [Caldimonas sp.]|nr:BTAD domain-containing putative transcriptional regulator [Caldimonas sp.]HEX2541415.1 BTAD domain-containing putative transcriptional regulator [Caldimonas sp.]